MSETIPKTYHFERALNQLKNYLSTPVEDERDQAGVIQAFEFTFEQAWKCIQKLAKDETVQVASPKKAFAFALQSGWIRPEDDALWSKMLADRNLTTHTYQEELAANVFAQIRDHYLGLFEELLTRIQEYDS